MTTKKVFHLFAVMVVICAAFVCFSVHTETAYAANGPFLHFTYGDDYYDLNYTANKEVYWKEITAGLGISGTVTDVQPGTTAFGRGFNEPPIAGLPDSGGYGFSMTGTVFSDPQTVTVTAGGRTYAISVSYASQTPLSDLYIGGSKEIRWPGTVKDTGGTGKVEVSVDDSGALTIVLDNFQYNGNGHVFTENLPEENTARLACGIYYTGARPLTIVSKQTNRIAVHASEDNMDGVIAVCSGMRETDRNNIITIQGNGTLSLESNAGNGDKCCMISSGIVSGGVIINNASANFTAGYAENSYGIYAHSQGIVIDGSSVTAAGGEAVDDSYGIYGNVYTGNDKKSGVRIKNSSTVTATGGKATGDSLRNILSCGIYGSTDANTGDGVYIDSGTVIATGGESTYNSYGIRGEAEVTGCGVLITGGNVTAASSRTKKYSENYGIYGDGTAHIETSIAGVRISGGTVVAESGDVTEGRTIGIRAGGGNSADYDHVCGLEITRGTVRVTAGNSADGASSCGVFASSGVSDKFGQHYRSGPGIRIGSGVTSVTFSIGTNCDIHRSSAIDSSTLVNERFAYGLSVVNAESGLVILPKSSAARQLEMIPGSGFSDFIIKKMVFEAAEYTCSAADNRLVGTCTRRYFDLPNHEISFSIMAPERTEAFGSGSASAALWGYMEFNDITGKGVSPNNIHYTGRDGTSYADSTAAPTSAGCYTASITVDGKQASIDYEIAKATPVISVYPYTTPIAYGQALENSQLYDGEANVPGTFTWADPSYTPSYKDDTASGFKVLFTPDDTTNYNTLELTASVDLTEKPKYKVVFEDGLGNVLKQDDVEIGQAAAAPSDPEREGYLFRGWDKEFGEITENTTVTAMWEITAARVMELISAIPDADTLKEEDAEKVEEARAACDSLTEEQKAQLTEEEKTQLENLIRRLEAAEARLKEWKEPKESEESKEPAESKESTESNESKESKESTESNESKPAVVSIKDAKVILSATAFTYNAKVQRPTIKTIGGNTLKEGTDYSLKWSNANSVKAGSYTVIITGEGRYFGTTSASYKITKAANPLKVSAKKTTVRFKKIKKKNLTLDIAKVIKFKKKGQGTITLRKLKGNKKITVKNAKGKEARKSCGKVTIKKGLGKGTYKVQVKVKAAGNTNYKASKVKKVTFTIIVK